MDTKMKKLIVQIEIDENMMRCKFDVSPQFLLPHTRYVERWTTVVPPPGLMRDVENGWRILEKRNPIAGFCGPGGKFQNCSPFIGWLVNRLGVQVAQALSTKKACSGSQKHIAKLDHSGRIVNKPIAGLSTTHAVLRFSDISGCLRVPNPVCNGGMPSSNSSQSTSGYNLRSSQGNRNTSGVIRTHSRQPQTTSSTNYSSSDEDEDDESLEDMMPKVEIPSDFFSRPVGSLQFEWFGEFPNTEEDVSYVQLPLPNGI
ncbi:hypothetical protein EV368DRAFT_70460, partial [Lentinula lateritia]